MQRPSSLGSFKEYVEENRGGLGAVSTSWNFAVEGPFFRSRVYSVR